jgi:hypothetical protein
MFRSRRNDEHGAAITRASADPFDQRDNDPFGPADGAVAAATAAHEQGSS